jgi:hypothetical protein
MHSFVCCLEPYPNVPGIYLVLEGKLAGFVFLGGEVGTNMIIEYRTTKKWKTCFDNVL